MKATAFMLAAILTACEIVEVRWVYCEAGEANMEAEPPTMKLSGCNDAAWEGRVLLWDGTRWFDPLNPDGPVRLPENLPAGVPRGD